MKNLLIQAIADSIKGNSTLPALSDFGGQTLTFRQLGRKIAEIHILYKAIGLRQGLSLIHISEPTRRSV